MTWGDLILNGNPTTHQLDVELSKKIVSAASSSKHKFTVRPIARVR